MSGSPRRAALRAVVRGRVQGVGFRWFAADAARAEGLLGEVFNRADGTVETTAEGARDALERYLAALRRGPSSAVVEAVESEWMPAVGGFDAFEIGSSRS